MTDKSTKNEPVLTDAVKSDVIQSVRTATAANRLAESEVETLIEHVIDVLREKGYVVTPPAQAKSGAREHHDDKPESKHR